MATFTSRPGGAADANPLDDVAFTLDDVTFTARGYLSMFRMAEVIRSVTEATDGQGVGMVTVAECIRQALGDAEYARFVGHVFSHNTDDAVIFAILDDLKAQMEANVQAATGRPTQPSAGSSNGEPDQDVPPARTIKLGTPGGSLRISDGESPSGLAAAVTASRGRPGGSRQGKGATRRTAAAS